MYIEREGGGITKVSAAVITKALYVTALAELTYTVITRLLSCCWVAKKQKLD
jgi:hypothetical protein